RRSSCRSRRPRRLVHGQVTTTAVRVLRARRDDHALVDDTATLGAGDLHLAAPEPGAVLHAPPQRPARRRRSCSSLELALALPKDANAAEAHADLGMLAESDDARLHGAVATAPTTDRARRLHHIRTNCGHRHVSILAVHDARCSLIAGPGDSTVRRVGVRRR